jgi:sucrose-6-phosphate hydrolase SacC (GH32 family)
VRPPSGGHNNDPAFPFRDPSTGFWHLSMDYCGGEAALDGKPGSEFHCAYTINGTVFPAALQTLAHFASRDLITWQYLPPMVAPTAPPGSASPGGDACPDSGGLGTGSATIVDGNPRLLFPAIHSCGIDLALSSRCFSQCVAEPENRSDPLLRVWKKRMIIDDRWPAGIDVNRHDDSAAFRVKDKWWMFLATGSTGPKPNHGVNLLYSSADFKSWRREHSLWNVSGGLLSCPEFFRLSNMPEGQYVYEHMGDVYWIGTLNESNISFAPLATVVQVGASSLSDVPPRGRYDYGAANAGKGHNDAGDHRRIEFGWIHEELVKPFAPSPWAEPQDYRGWDGCQTVPRALTFDAAAGRLKLLPATEVAGLRRRQVGHFRGTLQPRKPASVGSTGGRYLDLIGNFSRGSAPPNSSAGVLVRVGNHASTAITVQGSRLTVDTSRSGENCTIVACGRVASATVDGAEGAENFTLRVLLDGSVLETFVDFGAAGSAALTSRVYLRDGLDAEGVRVVGAAGTSASVTAFEMGAAVVADIMKITKGSGTTADGWPVVQPKSGSFFAGASKPWSQPNMPGVRVCPSTGDDSQLEQLLAGSQTAASDTIELATLSAAQSAARVLRQQRPDEPERMIEVVLCPEVHALRSPLRFTKQDHHQVWRGEQSLSSSAEQQAMQAVPTLSAAVHLPQDGWAKVPSKARAFESPIPAGVAPFRHLWRSGDGVRLKRTTLEGMNATCGGFDACTIDISPIACGQALHSHVCPADCRAPVRLQMPSDVAASHTAAGK